MFLHRTPIRLVGLTAVIAAGLAATSVLAFQPPSAVDLAQQGDDPAWAITEGLTTEIGPRPAGSDREAAARKWAVATLDRMGFSNVREESYRMPVWQRGEEQAWLTGPFLPQELAITALGTSGPTGAKGTEGEVAYFASFDALAAAPAGAVQGRIVFIDPQIDRKSFVQGKRGSGRGDHG